jgi:hypothetical protein
VNDKINQTAPIKQKDEAKKLMFDKRLAKGIVLNNFQE